MRLNMRIDSMTKNHLIVAILVALLSFSALARAAAAREDSQQLTQLLGEARDEAAELAKDADETESLIRSQASWETHAEMLDHVKEHVNNLARIIDKLLKPVLRVLNCRNRRPTGYCLCSRNWPPTRQLRLTT
jgi:hypothetical protein